jgi:polyhydroxyalkanoate synthesis repressor PhaR
MESTQVDDSLWRFRAQRVIIAVVENRAMGGHVQPQGSQPPSGGERQKRVVKRYSNRKLYDTRESRYVTLLQIAEMVRAGEEVQIIDNATKDDLTEVTLAQIIYEEQKQHSRSVPLQTLRDLIHQRGEKLMTQLREGPLGRLLPHDDKKEEPAVAAVPEEPVVDKSQAAEKKDEQKKNIFESSREAFESLQTKIDERVRSVLTSFSPFQQLQSKVQELGQRIEELEAKLKKQEDRPSGKK